MVFDHTKTAFTAYTKKPQTIPINKQKERKTTTTQQPNKIESDKQQPKTDKQQPTTNKQTNRHRATKSENKKKTAVDDKNKKIDFE